MKAAWFTRRTVPMHLALLVVVPGFLALAWWQLERALHGNTQSWAYTFEWPVFAGYAVYMWWDLVHYSRYNGSPGAGSAGAAPAVERCVNGTGGAGAASLAYPCEPRIYDDEGDEDLAEYNRYLASLAASGKRKTWRG